jgi:hypothetical protein
MLNKIGHRNSINLFTIIYYFLSGFLLQNAFSIDHYNRFGKSH